MTEESGAALAMSRIEPLSWAAAPDVPHTGTRTPRMRLRAASKRQPLGNTVLHRDINVPPLSAIWRSDDAAAHGRDALARANDIDRDRVWRQAPGAARACLMRTIRRLTARCLISRC